MPKLQFPEFRAVKGWEERPLNNFLSESRIPGSKGNVAKKITVKLWGNGVFEKNDTIQGSVNTQYFRRKAGQFIFSKLDFLNQAFGTIPPSLDNFESTASLAVDSPAEVLPPRLSEVFYKLQQQKKIWRPGQFTIPVFKTKLEIPNAYQNGVVNLIKPQVFSATKQAETQAAKLAVNGDLIQRGTIKGEQHKLIIVSTQETPDQAREIDEHIEPLFEAYGVRLIRPANADAFANEVEQNAH